MGEGLLDHEIINGYRIACAIEGPGGDGGVPIVLIHGTPSHSYIWRNATPRLVAAGHRVFRYDLLGFGASERPLNADTSVGGQGPVLEALLDRWGLARAHVVAHDIGGAIGLHLAVARPERCLSLTVIDTVSYDSWPSATWRKIIREHLDTYAAMSEQALRDMLTRQLRMTVFNKAAMSGDVLEAYLAPHAGPLGRASFFHHQVRHYDSRYTEEITSALGDIALPTQIIWGAEDEWQPVAYAKRLAKDIPGASLTIIPKAGHFLMEDAPEAVAENVIRFVRGAGG